MRVIMKKTQRGSEDGIHVQLYVQGQTYELGESLAASFVKGKVAQPAPEQTKQAKGPDENK